MPMSNYPNGFANGVSIQNVPFNVIVNPDAKTFWVDSNSGSNGNKGSNLAPFATIDYAIGRCTANKGDVIYVAAGHAETIISTTTLAPDVAGISIIGLGQGDDRPTLTFTTSTSAAVNIAAADVRISNFKFVCDIASQIVMLRFTKLNGIVDNCSFFEGSEVCVSMINVNGTGANTCDGTVIHNCKFHLPTSSGEQCINLNEVNDRVSITNCECWGDWDDACIHNVTGHVLTNLLIGECTLTNLQTGDHAIELVSACTGVARNLMMYTDTYATTIDPGALACFECYSVSSVDKNARLNPVVET